MHQRKLKCNCTVCSYVAVLLHASTSCAFLDYLTFNVDVSSHCWQWHGFSPVCFKMCSFRLAPWLQCVHLCGFTPVWTKQWLLKLIFKLKCFLHWVHLYFLVSAWNKNRHKNIVNMHRLHDVWQFSETSLKHRIVKNWKTSFKTSHR